MSLSYLHRSRTGCRRVLGHGHPVLFKRSLTPLTLGSRGRTVPPSPNSRRESTSTEVLVGWLSVDMGVEWLKVIWAFPRKEEVPEVQKPRLEVDDT